MKNLLIAALSTSTINALKQTKRMTVNASGTAAVATVVGVAMGAKKTSDWAAKAADKTEKASVSMAQWLLKRIPVTAE